MKKSNSKVLEAAQIGLLALTFGFAAHEGIQAALPTAQADHKVTSPCDAKSPPPLCGFVIG